jgi:hypothetical protein
LPYLFTIIICIFQALGLGGQKLLGIPIIVQPSQAEKNRAGQIAKTGALAAAAMTTTAPGPMKLYVGSLHFNITEDMLKGIFEPFGRIDEILLMKDHETGRSKGFGFITVIFNRYGRAQSCEKSVKIVILIIFHLFLNFQIIFGPSFTKEKTPSERWNS